MERMKPSAAGCSPTPLPLPSPHLIFISGAASTALGREQRNLTLAGPATSGAGACMGEGLRAPPPHPEGEPPGPSPPGTQPALGTRHRGRRQVGQDWDWEARNGDPERAKDLPSCFHWPLPLYFTHLKLRERKILQPLACPLFQLLHPHPNSRDVQSIDM